MISSTVTEAGLHQDDVPVVEWWAANPPGETMEPVVVREHVPAVTVVGSTGVLLVSGVMSGHGFVWSGTGTPVGLGIDDEAGAGGLSGPWSGYFAGVMNVPLPGNPALRTDSRSDAARRRHDYVLTIVDAVLTGAGVRKGTPRTAERRAQEVLQRMGVQNSRAETRG